VRARVAIAAVLALAACPEPDRTPCAEQPGFVCPIAGTGELGFNADGIAAVDADLYLVSAARRGPDDRIWVMDFNNHRLRRVADDGAIETIAGSGFHALADVTVPAVESPLENPIDFDFLADGRVVFTSYHDPRVLAVDAHGNFVVLAGNGELGLVGDEGDGGDALAAMFIQLDGIAVAPDDTIYVSDSKANRVRRIRGGIVETVAGTGEAAYTGDGGPGTMAALSWPTALELDPHGDLYIADTFNHAVRRLAADGTITTIAGSGVQGFAGDGGDPLAARLDQPFGLALDGDAVFVADRGNFRIRRIANGIIDTFAGTGMRGDAGDDGPCDAASFGYISRIALDGDGLLVADQGSSRVRRINF
jgi:hypothetical protein